MDKSLMSTLGIGGITELGEIHELENAPHPSELPPPKPSMNKIVGTNNLDDIFGITENPSAPKKKEGIFNEVKFDKNEPFGPGQKQEKIVEKISEKKEGNQDKKIEDNSYTLDFLKTSDIISDVKSESPKTNNEKTETEVESKTETKSVIAEPDTDAKSNKQVNLPASPTDSLSEYISDTIKELNKSIQDAPQEEKTSLGLKLSFYIKLSSYYSRLKTAIITIDHNKYYEEVKKYTYNVDQRFHTFADLSEAIQIIYGYKDRVSEIYRMALRDFNPRNRMYDFIEKMAIGFVDGKSSDIRKAEAADLLSVLHAELVKSEVFFKFITEVYANINGAYDMISRQITIFQELNKEISRGALPFVPQSAMDDVDKITNELHQNSKVGENIRQLRSKPTHTLGVKEWNEIEK